MLRLFAALIAWTIFLGMRLRRWVFRPLSRLSGIACLVLLALQAVAVALMPHMCAGGNCAAAGRELAAPVAPLVKFPASWTVPQWVVDSRNNSGCASDSNNCTQTTCGAAGSLQGPCATYGEIYWNRWGCSGGSGCPRLRQNTQIRFLTQMLAPGGDQDPIIAKWSVEAGAVVELIGPLTSAQQQATGTITVVAARNTGTGQLLRVTLPAPTGAYAEGMLVVNSTHASRALLFSNPAGNDWLLSQPFVPATAPTNYLSLPAENDTAWANGDTVTVYNQAAINMVDIEPVVPDFSAAFNGGTFIEQLQFGYFGPSALGPPVILGNGIVILDSFSARGLALQTAPSQPGGRGVLAFNTGTTQNLVAIPGASNQTAANMWVGGFVDNASTTGVAGMLWDGEAIIGAGGGTGAADCTNSTVASLMVPTGATLSVSSGTCLTLPGLYAGSPRVWGAGATNAVGGRFQYQIGAANAAATFLNTGGLKIDGQTKACLARPTDAAEFATCNVTTAVATFDANLGATYGCYLSGGAGGYCN